MLTADLMVGFPGESEEDFLDTFSFVSEAGLLDAHVFAYSKREGTPAAEYDNQIPESVKKERSARLIAECARVRDEVLQSVIEKGHPLSVIMETKKGRVYNGHSDSYIEVSALLSLPSFLLRSIFRKQLHCRPLFDENSLHP